MNKPITPTPPAPTDDEVREAREQLEGQIKNMSPNCWAFAVKPETIRTILTALDRAKGEAFALSAMHCDQARAGDRGYITCAVRAPRLTGEQKEAAWQPIETAPKDGTAILGWCVHGADPYYENEGKTLTSYGCHCEGLSHVDDGPHVVMWVDDYQDGDWENDYVTIPGWWFRSDSDCEVVANPTHWIPIPDRAAFPEVFAVGREIWVGSGDAALLLCRACLEHPIGRTYKTTQEEEINLARLFAASQDLSEALEALLAASHPVAHRGKAACAGRIRAKRLARAALDRAQGEALEQRQAEFERRSEPTVLWPDDDPMVVAMAAERDALRAENARLVKELAALKGEK